MHIIPTIERTGQGLAVSSETIAEGAGVEHRAVLQMIGKNVDDLETFGTVAFEMRPLPGGGHPVRVALLNEQQSTLLMTYLRNTEQVKRFKVALVKAFYEMAQAIQSRPAVELTRADLARMVLESEAENNELRREVEAAAPKANYVDQFVADGDNLKISAVASRLDVKESQLRALLIACEWIYRETSERYSEKRKAKVPQYRYSERANHKSHFNRVMVHDAPRFKGEVDHTLKVTPPGAQAIGRLLDRVLEKYGDLDEAIAVIDTERLRRRSLQAVV
ncbi:Rha family transcriptional regulator [Citricoccus sp. NR2]|uniref:Rha family transcriptional regulator n=1 Tax=Citricoccus sp. NR2 TaxID=3004095 RepID=UPI0022DE86C1|nr:Rha family transcriptional regulator [Citricoccus sp. NR2]WBL18473.1 Rha family transcriptional regulator [Citricoccus sp. NR2]